MFLNSFDHFFKEQLNRVIKKFFYFFKVNSFFLLHIKKMFIPNT